MADVNYCRGSHSDATDSGSGPNECDPFYTPDWPHWVDSLCSCVISSVLFIETSWGMGSGPVTAC